MNYLAHLVLAYPYQNLMVGNYLADFIQKRDEKNILADFLPGISFHRWIDNYTDHHATVDELNVIFRPAVHKYAPVATDIVMDYFLHFNWSLVMEVDYDVFAEKIYDLLKLKSMDFPEPAQTITHRMIQGSWLDQYKSMEGLADVMNRMNRKAKFDVQFENTLEIVQSQHDKLNALFLHFYQDISREAVSWLNLRNEMKS